MKRMHPCQCLTKFHTLYLQKPLLLRLWCGFLCMSHAAAISAGNVLLGTELCPICVGDVWWGNVVCPAYVVSARAGSLWHAELWPSDVRSKVGVQEAWRAMTGE